MARPFYLRCISEKKDEPRNYKSAELALGFLGECGFPRRVQCLYNYRALFQAGSILSEEKRFRGTPFFSSHLLVPLV